MRYLRTAHGRSHLETETQGSVRYRVYFKTLQGMKIPLAPPQLQQQAERLFLGLRKVFEPVIAALEDLPNLETAILTKAFRGDLVPQDPADEPAAALLERLRRDREEAAPGPKAPRRPR